MRVSSTPRDVDLGEGEWKFPIAATVHCGIVSIHRVEKSLDAILWADHSSDNSPRGSERVSSRRGGDSFAFPA